MEQASITFRALLDKNPNAHAYLDGYLQAQGISPSKSKASNGAASSEKIKGILDDLTAALPNSSAVTRAALNLLEGAEFEARAKAYIERFCQKGVPSLFSSLKTLYEDEAKRDSVGSIAEALRVEWDPSTNSEGEHSVSFRAGFVLELTQPNSDDTEAPSTYLWLLYFLAQHESFTGNQVRALAYIDSAIAHSPTLPELHMTRARILKRAGDLLGASHAAEDARLLDGQDRYLNCKSAKYMLRVDDVETASKTAGLFTKPEANPVTDLLDMQAFWYLTEEADAYYRLQNWPMALKRLTQVEALIEDFWHDQLDFHGYCIRKYTFRSYIRTVRWEDEIRRHPALVRAQLQLVRLCCAAHDEANLLKAKPVNLRAGPAVAVRNAQRQQTGEHKTNGSAANGSATGELSASQAKKAAARAKKAAALAEAAKKAADKAAQDAGKKKKDDDDELPPPPKDEDPDGTKALSELEPLEAARKVCAVMQQNIPDDVRTWIASLEWALRESEYDCWDFYLRAFGSPAHIHS